jgi:hypothetical protein
MAYLVDEVAHKKIDQILLVSEQDSINYDYAEPYPSTTRGTPQEADVRWQKMFMIVGSLWTEAIEILKQIANVHVINMPGNHATQTGFYLGEVLKARFSNDENVTIDNRPLTRRYYMYGKSMIGIAHGKYEKPGQIHNLMSIDDPKMWSKVNHRYFFLGDKHHDEDMLSKKAMFTRGEDWKGVVVEYLRAMSLTDKYEYRQGYVGTIRGATGMLFNYESGRTHKIGYSI